MNANFKLIGLFVLMIVLSFSLVVVDNRLPLGKILGVNIPVKASVLESSFFINDQTAIKIVSGIRYELNQNNLIVTLPSGNQGMNPNSFEFKLLNAFKQLGFTRLTETSFQGEKIVSATLHRFQKNNNLPMTDYVDKTTMLKIDKVLFLQEKSDILSSRLYPALSVFSPAPVNEATNVHLAALYYNFFSSLPRRIFDRVLTLDDFRYSNIYNLGEIMCVMMDKNMTRILPLLERIDVVNNKSDFRCCNTFYFEGHDYLTGGSCTGQPEKYYSGGAHITDDYTYFSLIVHEYGHHQGGNWISVGEKMVNTAHEFGKISFDMTIPAPYDSNGSNTLLRSKGDVNGEFVTDYAITNNSEDFADSFSAYIMAGNIFRQRAKLNPYLNQKYEFLKTNIFEGREYLTGSISSYDRWVKIYPGRLPAWTTTYMYEDPSWVWDYKYPIYKSIVNSKLIPTLACKPRPTCLDVYPNPCKVAQPIGGWCPNKYPSM